MITIMAGHRFLIAVQYRLRIHESAILHSMTNQNVSNQCNTQR